MKPHKAAQCSLVLPLALTAVVLLFALASMSGCGPREPDTQALPAPSAPAAPSPGRAEAPAAPASAESVPNATATAPPQGDPFAAVDVAADERLSQLLRLSDKPRAPEFKAAPPAAPRVQNVAPTAPAEPVRPERPAEALAAAPPAPASTAPPPAAAQESAAESVAPAAAVAAPTASPESPRPPLLRAVERSQPPFPPEAQRDGVVSGRVIAAITVQPNGSVSQVDIIEASPPRVFDRTVRNTLLRWRFEPVPQQVRANVEIAFNVAQ